MRAHARPACGTGHTLLQLAALGDQALDDAAGDAAPLLADAVAQFGHARRVRTAWAIDGLWRNVEAGHDARVLADEIEFGNVRMKTGFRREDQAAAVGDEQFV